MFPVNWLIFESMRIWKINKYIKCLPESKMVSLYLVGIVLSNNPKSKDTQLWHMKQGKAAANPNFPEVGIFWKCFVNRIKFWMIPQKKLLFQRNLSSGKQSLHLEAISINPVDITLSLWVSADTHAHSLTAAQDRTALWCHHTEAPIQIACTA